MRKGTEHLAPHSIQRLGLFYIGYGTGWLVGSVAAGILYERSLIALISFAVAAQLASVPVFVMGARASR